MSGPVKRAWRRSSYHERPQTALLRGSALAAVFGLCVLSGGCSFSYQLDSMLGKKEDKSDTTGSVGLKPVAVNESLEFAAEGDLAYARQAAAEVLNRGGKDTSAPWQNPRTGARGTVTPIASAYTQDGLTCRDFLASYVRSGSESWLQGEACQAQQGKWEVRNLRPWRRT